MEVNSTHTSKATMLQRLPAILAVTASSYGLQLQPAGTRRPQASGTRQRNERNRAQGKAIAQG